MEQLGAGTTVITMADPNTPSDELIRKKKRREAKSYLDVKKDEVQDQRVSSVVEDSIDVSSEPIIIQKVSKKKTSKLFSYFILNS